MERETGFEPATFCLGSLSLVSVWREREFTSGSASVRVS